MTAVQHAAQEAVKAGLSIVPPREDGSKAPDGCWKQYQTERPTAEVLRSWYGPRTGLGVVCGQVSGNVESLEFDDRDVYNRLIELAHQADFGDVIQRLENGYAEDSPSGGVHWLYRCETVGGNTKLATRPKRPDEQRDPQDRVKTLIETRGEGGYLILAPSNGRVHPSGGAYVLRAGSFATIPTLTPEERRDLFQLAHAFHDPGPAGDTRPTTGRKALSPEAGGRPGDDFNRRATWPDVLVPADWTAVFERDGTTYWRRPGKDHGTSATTNRGGSDYLIVFSTSTPFETQRAYSKFSAYGILNHAGDFNEAARRLALQGYGVPLPESMLGTPARPDDHDAHTHRATPPTYALTELGDAESFAATYGDTLRWDFQRARWLVFTQHRWAPDLSNAVIRFAVDHVRRQQQRAVNLADQDARQRLLAHWLKFDRRAAIDNVLALARSLAPIADDGTNWDRHPWLLGCTNGVLDLTTGQLRDGHPTDRITLSTGLAFDSEARCPRWEQFIDEVLPDPDVADFVRRALGYSLTADMREQCVLLLYGKGRNGKSTLVDVVMLVIGDYGHVAAFSMFEQQQAGAQSYDLASIDGARLVVASEGSGRWLHSARLKDLSGGEQVSARHPYGRPFQFRPSCKIWLSTNELPRVADESDGLWRRLRQVPFVQKFEGASDNRTLKDELLAESAGILTWLVRGCLDWQHSGLLAPPAVANATAQYRADSDPLGGFLEEACELVDGAEIRANEFYQHYLQWAKAAGLNTREQLSSTMFGRKAADKFKRDDRRGGRVYVGVARV